MAFENIQIAHGNFSMDRSGSAFYTMDHNSTQLIKKDFAGAVIFSFFLATTILEVQSLQFDGFYYWSLERQGTSGFRVRKWEIGSDDLVRAIDTFSFATDVINKYDVNAMAVENYSDTLDNIEVVGTTTFDVVDGSVVRVGDDLIIGPSTAVGFEGEFSSVTVIGKVGDTTLTVSPALDATFSPGDTLVWNRSFFMFSDTAPANQSGALYKFRSSDGFVLALNGSNMFNGVRAATFFGGKLLFVRAGEIIHLNPDSQNIFKSQAIDNLDEERGEHHTAFDLEGFSNTLYRLEQQHVSFNESLDRWETEDWDPLFNINTSSVIPEVYFVAVKAEPPTLHKLATGVAAIDLDSEITVTVLDQFRTPVFNRVVDFTSDGGPLSSIQETTDANGQVRVTYTANASVGEVTITAEVT